MTDAIIEFDKVVAGYSPSLTILNETTLDARQGEITLLIGPNGAGKSTVLKTLFGILVPRSGEVRLEGKCINGRTPRQLLADGIAFVPQGRNLFGSLSVRHNLELGGITLPRGELAGRIEEALERFDEQAATTKRPWALATSARCRGLLRSAAGDLAGAVVSLETAVVAHGNVDIPFELARTLLVKGQIHRRRKEKLLARDALLKSAEIFDRLGSRLWAERARVELGRVGSRKSDRHDLTVTEERVASLAASGLTNRVIAERAFLSPKTVEANLARVYQKLGINSRAQLGRAMGERERAAAK